MGLRDKNGTKVQYKRLRNVDTEKYTAAQFYRPKSSPPVKSILVATGLFLLGSLLLTLAILLLTGVIESEFWDRCYPLFFLGSILFIPGFYHVRLAYYAWKGYKGYSYDDIPSYD